MKNYSRKKLLLSTLWFIGFIVFTLIVKNVDVQQTGSNHSSIGLATINHWIYDFLGSSSLWYDISKYFGYLSMGCVLFFGAMGLLELVKRKKIALVDKDIILLGVLYVIVIMFYLFFEVVTINYRPVIIDGSLESSYPSSHVLFAICFVGTAMTQANLRIKNKKYLSIIKFLLLLIMLATILGRLLSGVHWFSDIIGAILLGMSLCELYSSFVVKNIK